MISVIASQPLILGDDLAGKMSQKNEIARD
jgi:hypothetical protein